MPTTASGDIIQEISGSIAEMLWLDVDKRYGHQMRVAQTLRDSNSVETIRSRDSGVH